MRPRGRVAAALAAGLGSVWLIFAGSAAVGSECGVASWYGLSGLTASGEDIVPGALTAAHRSLPFGTRVKVENLGNGRAVVVRINDRGPFVGGRAIDLTRAAAEKLGFINDGVARVRMTVVDGDPTGLRGGCGQNGSGKVAAVVVPLPRLRPPSLALRFGFAFASGDQTPGARRVARELAIRSADPSRQVAALVPLLSPRPATSFSERFGYLFLPSDKSQMLPGERRQVAILTAADLGKFISNR